MKMFSVISSVVKRVAPNYGKDKDASTQEATDSDSGSGSGGDNEIISASKRDKKEGSKEGGSGRTWWQFLRGIEGGKSDCDASSEEDSSVKQTRASDDKADDAGESGLRNWPWEFWKPAKDEQKNNRTKDAVNAADRPVESVYIPPDLPIEEIAKELALLKEESWRSKDDQVSKLWNNAVEKKDRSWVILLCCLLAVAIALLSDVAFLINNPT
eukprot:gene2500-5457_t